MQWPLPGCRLIRAGSHINQQIALKTIKKLNFGVQAVWNGKEAVEYLSQDFSTQHPRPDLILMDVSICPGAQTEFCTDSIYQVQMPIMDGVSSVISCSLCFFVGQRFNRLISRHITSSMNSGCIEFSVTKTWFFNSNILTIQPWRKVLT